GPQESFPSVPSAYCDDTSLRRRRKANATSDTERSAGATGTASGATAGGYFSVKVTSDRPEISISSPSAKETVTSGTLKPSSSPRISFVAGSPQSSLTTKLPLSPSAGVAT